MHQIHQIPMNVFVLSISGYELNFTYFYAMARFSLHNDSLIPLSSNVPYILPGSLSDNTRR